MAKPIPQEQTKEQIKINTELFRFYAVVFLALSSGVLSLLLRDDRQEFETIILVGGYILLTINIFTLFYRSWYIKQLIRKLK